MDGRAPADRHGGLPMATAATMAELPGEEVPVGSIDKVTRFRPAQVPPAGRRTGPATGANGPIP
ncbi:hypothetical protein ACFWA9_23845 [Kitasatospora sp. NPDC059973]|uniref:hypothetical protein n=1 Tax=unclassified Kitasatospora TaxID=2633591 RepID=UPI003316580F